MHSNPWLRHGLENRSLSGCICSRTSGCSRAVKLSGNSAKQLERCDTLRSEILRAHLIDRSRYVAGHLMAIRISMPRPIWFFMTAGSLLVVFVGLRLGLPMYFEQRAIHAIEQLGGVVTTSKGGPRWLRRFVGDEWMSMFNHAETVNLGGADLTDQELTHLRSMPRLWSLFLDATPITDRGLEEIAQLPRLSVLTLDSTSVTGKGIIHLQGLRRLQKLSLDATRIKDADLPQLSRFPALEGVSLDDTSVSDAGIATLCSAARLKRVSLNGTRVTESGREKLKRAFGSMVLYGPQFQSL